MDPYRMMDDRTISTRGPLTKLEAEIERLREELAIKQAIIDRWDEIHEHEKEWQCNELARLHSLLESLTPGGSEFHDDPDRCYEFIKDRMSKVISLREALKLAISALEDSDHFLKSLRAWTDRLGWVEVHTNLEKFDAVLVGNAAALTALKDV